MPLKRPQPRDVRMGRHELSDALAKLGLDSERAADFLGINERTMRRWLAKGGVNQLAAARLLRLMVDHQIDPEAVQ